VAKDLLFEIGTEEIPARFMPEALGQLAGNALKALLEARIDHAGVQTFGTPRRLVLSVKAVAELQADQTTRKKGPSAKVAYDAAGNPSKALEGFARSSGVAVDQLINEEGYMYASLHEVGKPVRELLPNLLLQLVETQNFPKNMRWGDLDFRFVRPLHWLVALFGDEIIPVSIAGIDAGRVSKGHRILGSDSVEIANPAAYRGKMLENYVVVDPAERREMIRRQVEVLAVEQGGTATIDDELLEEVLYLVEYPTALCGRFEDKYLELPVEAIITPMREHQRYFPVFSKEGRLLPVFITVRNGSADYIDNVRRGNERVLRARLADAQFFFDEDRKAPLADRVEKLKTIVFQEGLGTMHDKVLRLQKLSLFIAGLLGITGEETVTVERAARLAKADLVTGMVCEFTELQGVMGREYALLSGETPAVADAIFEHYLPRFAGDILPQTPAGRIISIADKFDNILTTFSRGKIPTGSQDPYALRRQALGIVNILIEGKLSLSLRRVFLAAFDLVGIMDNDKRSQIGAALYDFFRQRLNVRNVLGDAGIRYDIIDALLATDTDDIYQTWLWAQAMASEEGTAAMERAVEAFTRAANLAGKAQTEVVESALFEVDAEKQLFRALVSAQKKVEALTAKRDYVAVLKEIAELSAPIDNFFNEVMVMVDDAKIRDNRLALLSAICGLTRNIADFSRIVPQK
jgi:glycyl-tRNA synthetase beta chain